MKYALSCIILAITSLIGLGQDISIMGKVTDENGKPVANVHIVTDGNLGDATSESSGIYRLTLLSAVKPGQEITLRIEDKRFELFTMGIVAGDQLKDISLVHKKKNSIGGKNKDSADGSKMAQTITLDHPTFNAPAQIGNNNTQNITNPGVAFVPINDSLRIAVMMNLAALKRKYPNAKPIFVKYENGNTRLSVAKALGELLENAGIGSFNLNPMYGYDNEHVFNIGCSAEDTTYMKDFMIAISPLLNTKIYWERFDWGSKDQILIFILGIPLFKQNGSYLIE